jgi:hypothetical protein
MALFLLCLGTALSLAPTMPTDRLVEFSWRTFGGDSSVKQGALAKIGTCANTAAGEFSLNNSTIRFPASNLCLEVFGAFTAAGTKVDGWACEPQTKYHNQEWVYNESTQTLQTKQNYFCMEATATLGAQLTMQPCTPGKLTQQWNLVHGENNLIQIAPKSDPSQCVVLYGGRQSVEAQVDQMVERLAPLFQHAAGEQILVGSFGWLLDLVTEFQGNASQSYPFVNHDAPQWSLGNATYDDVRTFVGYIKTAAAKHHLPRLKVGFLFVGWSHIYSIPNGPFVQRHPEVYRGGYSINHGHEGGMTDDSYPYASQKGGSIRGQSFFDLWGKQWGAFSKYVGADAVVIRDGFSTACDYQRTGPFGATASANGTANKAYMDGVRSLFEETKKGNPACSVIGYSQASSAIGEWKVGLTDLEQIVSDGYIDGWIDQSWAGAWQDVPTRATSGLGWTHQLGYILAHRAQIEGGNRRRQTVAVQSAGSSARSQRCKHYVLHDTFDSYEGWDTLHNVPSKLQWGIWAFNHAAFKRPDGSLSLSDGQYISWANSWSYVKEVSGGHAGSGAYLSNPTGLLPRSDVKLLAETLNQAQRSMAQMHEVYGPTLVYNRHTLVELLETDPASNNYEYVDEQVGMLAKFGLPVLSVARLEDGLPVHPVRSVRSVQSSIHPERSSASPTNEMSAKSAIAGSTSFGYILSVPSQGAVKNSSGLQANISKLADAGVPMLVVGRADRIDMQILTLAGAAIASSASSASGTSSASRSNASVADSQSLIPSGWQNVTLTDSTKDGLVAPEERVFFSPVAAVKAAKGGTIVGHFKAGSQGTNQESAVLSTGSNGSVMWAQMNDWANGHGEDISRANLGTPGLFQAAAEHLLRGCRSTSSCPMYLLGVNESMPVTMSGWRSGPGEGTAKVLLGNLESVYCASRACSLSGDANTWRSVTLVLNPSALGVGVIAPSTACASTSNSPRCWTLRTIDGMLLDQTALENGVSHEVRFAVTLEPREARVYELVAGGAC